MSLLRYAKKRDENESEIIDALECIGCTVYPMDTPCDLLVGRGAKNILMEVKNPKRYSKKTTAQKMFFKTWKGQICIVKTVEEAIAVVTKLTVKNAL